jgi:NAD(P)-dependent dehydrogenase (short-subunit alcohol dehydrogenase family)
MGTDKWGSLEGRVVLVTGATSGIGLATSRALANNGCAARHTCAHCWLVFHVLAHDGSARVAMCGRRQQEGEEEAVAIRSAGGDASFFACDVSSEADCVSVVARAVERYGRLDGAFNNAGVGGGDWEATSAADYDTVMDVNLRGAYFCLREEVAQMRRQSGGGGGSIVNCGSTNSHRAAAGQSLQYTVSKHAI